MGVDQKGGARKGGDTVGRASRGRGVTVMVGNDRVLLDHRGFGTALQKLPGRILLEPKITHRGTGHEPQQNLNPHTVPPQGKVAILHCKSHIPPTNPTGK